MEMAKAMEPALAKERAWVVRLDFEKRPWAESRTQKAEGGLLGESSGPLLLKH